MPRPRSTGQDFDPDTGLYYPIYAREPEAGEIPCPDCKGEGSRQCSSCAGIGEYPLSGGDYWVRCRTCGGGGEVTCPECHGEGVVEGPDVDFFEEADRGLT